MSENEKEQLNEDYQNLEKFCASLESIAQICSLKYDEMNMLYENYFLRAACLIRELNKNIQLYKSERDIRLDVLYIPGKELTEKLKDLNEKRAEKGLPPV